MPLRYSDYGESGAQEYVQQQPMPLGTDIDMEDTNENDAQCSPIRVQSIAPFSIQTLFDTATANGSLRIFEDNDTADDKLMSVIRFVLYNHEGRWTTIGHLVEFFSHCGRLLCDPASTATIRNRLGLSYAHLDHTVYRQVTLRVHERLMMAEAAALADDPQLAVSIIHYRVFIAMELSRYAEEHGIPLEDIVGETRHAQARDNFILLDSAYVRHRFPVMIAELPDLIQSARTASKERPDGFFQEIPSGVLLGQSNHEARRKALSSYLNKIGEIVIEARNRGESPEHCLHLIRTVLTAWQSRQADRSYRHLALPSPPGTDTVARFQQIDPPEATMTMARFYEAFQARVEYETQPLPLYESFRFQGPTEEQDPVPPQYETEHVRPPSYEATGAQELLIQLLRPRLYQAILDAAGRRDW